MILFGGGKFACYVSNGEHPSKQGLKGVMSRHHVIIRM